MHKHAALIGVAFIVIAVLVYWWYKGGLSIGSKTAATPSVPSGATGPVLVAPGGAMGEAAINT